MIIQNDAKSIRLADKNKTSGGKFVTTSNVPLISFEGGSGPAPSPFGNEQFRPVTQEEIKKYSAMLGNLRRLYCVPFDNGALIYGNIAWENWEQFPGGFAGGGTTCYLWIPSNSLSIKKAIWMAQDQTETGYTSLFDAIVVSDHRTSFSPEPITAEELEHLQLLYDILAKMRLKMQNIGFVFDNNHNLITPSKIDQEIKTASPAPEKEEDVAKNPVFLGYGKLDSKDKLEGVKLVSQRQALEIYFEAPHKGHVAYRHIGHENGFTSTGYGMGNRHPNLWLQIWGDNPEWELDLPQERPTE